MSAFYSFGDIPPSGLCPEQFSQLQGMKGDYLSLFFVEIPSSNKGEPLFCQCYGSAIDGLMLI